MRVLTHAENSNPEEMKTFLDTCITQSLIPENRFERAVKGFKITFEPEEFDSVVRYLEEKHNIKIKRNKRSGRKSAEIRTNIGKIMW